MPKNEAKGSFSLPQNLPVNRFNQEFFKSWTILEKHFQNKKGLTLRPNPIHSLRLSRSTEEASVTPLASLDAKELLHRLVCFFFEFCLDLFLPSGQLFVHELNQATSIIIQFRHDVEVFFVTLSCKLYCLSFLLVSPFDSPLSEANQLIIREESVFHLLAPTVSVETTYNDYGWL